MWFIGKLESPIVHVDWPILIESSKGSDYQLLEVHWLPSTISRYGRCGQLLPLAMY